MSESNTVTQNIVDKTITGTVVSNSMDKTVVVNVDRRLKHPLYGKTIKRSTKIFAHDENNDYVVGDVVKIKQCRPLSKKKSWSVVEKA